MHVRANSRSVWNEIKKNSFRDRSHYCTMMLLPSDVRLIACESSLRAMVFFGARLPFCPDPNEMKSSDLPRAFDNGAARFAGAQWRFARLRGRSVGRGRPRGGRQPAPRSRRRRHATPAAAARLSAALFSAAIPPCRPQSAAAAASRVPDRSVWRPVRVAPLQPAGFEERGRPKPCTCRKLSHFGTGCVHLSGSPE
ncbi:hypothetical protein YQE_10575, partial [Dendroctonus ponderosae]